MRVDIDEDVVVEFNPLNLKQGDTFISPTGRVFMRTDSNNRGSEILDLECGAHLHMVGWSHNCKIVKLKVSLDGGN